MLDWLTRLIEGWGLTWGKVFLGLGLSVLMFLVSTAIVTFILVKLPANYFHPSHDRAFLVERHPVLRAIGIFAKNLLGLVLVGGGVIMSLPGVPGPGVLTILLGIMLLDFPGKRALELKLISRPSVLGAINRTRRRFSRQPLL